MASSSPCPPLGPAFPAPTFDGSSGGALTAAAANVSTALDLLFRDNTTSFNSSTASLSIELVSTHQRRPLFQYHHTASVLNDSGTTNVTADSVYRIASVTKVFTVLALLLHENSFKWNDPITKYVPELSSQQEDGNDVTKVQWQQVTLEMLASQLAGVPRDTADLATLYPLQWEQLGFPALNASDLPACGLTEQQPACSRQQYLTAVGKRDPVFPPGSTPSYSNLAYVLLGFAIEAITGRDYAAVIKENIFAPLQMCHSSLRAPPNKQGVIPVGDSQWSWYQGPMIASGGIYTSASDLSAFARGVLSSKLLRPAQTQWWVKPHSHSSSLTISVGAPWEIYRSGSLTSDGRILDLYTKNGGLGEYGSLLVLVPDYGVALTILMAGDTSPLNQIAELLLQQLLPVIDDVARAEAVSRYAGTYSSGNSSLVISVEPGSDLTITRWAQSGNDILQTYASFFTFFQGGQLNIYPSGLRSYQQSSESENGRPSAEESFRGVFLGPPAQYDGFLNQCSSWEGFDGNIYGQRALDEFIFRSDDSGKVTSVEPRAFRVELHKV